MNAAEVSLDHIIMQAVCRLFVRCERQTLSRLPKSGAILFTIRTYVRPLREYLQKDKASLHRLRSAVQHLPDVWVTLSSLLKFVWQYRHGDFAKSPSSPLKKRTDGVMHASPGNHFYRGADVCLIHCMAS